MSQSDLRDEITQTSELLLPIEKKLIGFNLGLGLVLLVIPKQKPAIAPAFAFVGFHDAA